jgi:hypothetical protein
MAARQHRLILGDPIGGVRLRGSGVGYRVTGVGCQVMHIRRLTPEH